MHSWGLHVWCGTAQVAMLSRRQTLTRQGSKGGARRWPWGAGRRWGGWQGGWRAGGGMAAVVCKRWEGGGGRWEHRRPPLHHKRLMERCTG